MADRVWTLPDGEEVAKWKEESGGGSSPFPAASSGDGPPTADPTTLDPGTAYMDTTNGALYMVVDAIGTNVWVLVGGEIDGDAEFEGVILGNGVGFVATPTNGVQLVITDLDAYNNSGNGIRWEGTGTDGQQTFSVKMGSHFFRYASDGSVDVTESTAIFTSETVLPTSDPGVAGQLYQDAVTHAVFVSQG